MHTKHNTQNNRIMSAEEPKVTLNQMWFSKKPLLNEVRNLPDTVRDIIQLYTMSSPIKTELTEHFYTLARDHTEELWWKVSIDWVRYVGDLENWAGAQQHEQVGDLCGEFGLGHIRTVIYASPGIPHRHDLECWDRRMPIRDARCTNDKIAISHAD